MLHAWQLAQFAKVDCAWAWPNTAADTDNDYDMFNLFDRAATERLAETAGLRIYATEQELAEIYGPKATLSHARPPGDTVIEVDGKVVLPDDEVVWHNYTGSALFKYKQAQASAAKPGELFRLLTITAAVQAAVDDIDARFNLSDAVALHLRRGDVVRSVFYDGRKSMRFPDSGPIRGFVGRFLPMTTVKRVLEAELEPNQNIVFFSDGIEDRRHMESLYGDQLIDVHSVLDQHDLLPLQRALCELLVMSRVRRIYGGRSTYPLCASYIGGAQMVRLTWAVTAEDLIPELKDILAKTTHSLTDRDRILANVLLAYRQHFLRIANGRGGEAHVEAIDRELRAPGNDGQPLEAFCGAWRNAHGK